MEKIKKSFRGYNKKAVHALLEEMSEQYEQDRVRFSEENGKLRDELARANARIAELEGKIDSLAGEKDYVASAIVSAEKEAAKIIAMAHVKAQEMAAETERALRDERAQTRQIRQSVLKAMQDYQTKLDDAITPDDEAQ